MLLPITLPVSTTVSYKHLSTVGQSVNNSEHRDSYITVGMLPEVDTPEIHLSYLRYTSQPIDTLEMYLLAS